MKLYDYPDFSASNPWQRKTIDTAAPMSVVRSSVWPPPADCQLVHVGWEDWLMRGTHSEAEADQRVPQAVELVAETPIRRDHAAVGLGREQLARAVGGMVVEKPEVPHAELPVVGQEVWEEIPLVAHDREHGHSRVVLPGPGDHVEPK